MKTIFASCTVWKPVPASKSYGLQVAQLAGVPRPVIQAAKAKLHELENRERHTSVAENQSPAPQSNEGCSGTV